MTLGEFRKITEQYADECEVKLSENFASLGWAAEANEVIIKVDAQEETQPEIILMAN